MAEKLTTVEIPIGGMTCASCVARNERALRRLAGVSSASVNFATERATVTYDPAQLDVGRLTTTIEQAGYEVPTATETLAISGMTCASCVARNEKALARVPGVLRRPGQPGHREGHRRVSARSRRPRRPRGGGAAGRLRSSRAGPPHRAGQPTPRDEADPEALARRAAYLRLRRKVVVGAVLSALVFLGSMGFAFVPSLLTNGWVLWALATPVQFWVGRQFYRAALAAARHGTHHHGHPRRPGLLGGLPLQRRRRAVPRLLRPPRARRADVLRLRRAHHHADPARPPARGARQGPDRRGHPHADRPAAAHGARAARRARDRRADRRGASTTTSCACARARRCRSTASSSRARRPSTSPCSPASRCRSARAPATRSSARP